MIFCLGIVKLEEWESACIFHPHLILSYFHIPLFSLDLSLYVRLKAREFHMLKKISKILSGQENCIKYFYNPKECVTHHTVVRLMTCYIEPETGTTFLDFVKSFLNLLTRLFKIPLNNI